MVRLQLLNYIPTASILQFIKDQYKLFTIYILFIIVIYCVYIADATFNEYCYQISDVVMLLK